MLRLNRNYDTSGLYDAKKFSDATFRVLNVFQDGNTYDCVEGIIRSRNIINWREDVDIRSIVAGPAEILIYKRPLDKMRDIAPPGTGIQHMAPEVNPFCFKSISS